MIMQASSTPANLTTRWLMCRVDKGMFSDELCVTYPMTGESQFSFFVPSSEVSQTQTPGPGRVRVWVGHRDEFTVAFLPTPYREMIEVSQSDLSESP
jgi:hypothetical protein